VSAKAAGSGIVQIALLAGLASTTSVLLGAAIALAAVALLVGRQFERLYLDVIERQLMKYDEPHVNVIAEPGRTLLEAPHDPACLRLRRRPATLGQHRRSTRSCKFSRSSDRGTWHASPPL
jgi:hypothetical protein